MLEKYRKGTCMLINIAKQILDHNEFTEDLTQQERELILYPTITISEGFKYLRFFIKPNSYAFQDWAWLYKKVEA